MKEGSPARRARAVQRPRESALPRVRATASVLDAPVTRGRSGHLIAGLGAAVLHAAFVGIAMLLGARGPRPQVPAVISQMIEIEVPPPPAPEPLPAEPSVVPEPEPPKAVVRNKPALPPPPKPAKPAPELEPPKEQAPPPEAAQASAALTAPEEAKVEASNTVVTGQGANYAGGVTEAGGTAQRAVYDANARAGGVQGGTGTEVLVDRSRAPTLAGKAVWDCPFPEEADEVGINHAVVSLRVEVAADGSVTAVKVTGDPGDGFGREARRCALQKRWSPGLDRAGKATGSMAVVNVRFDR